MTVVVIPAYNEEKSIGRVIRDLFERGYKNVVVVNDGSSDTTASLAEQAGAKVLNHPINRGQGAALQTGDDYAVFIGAENVVHFDADGQFNAVDISGALRLMAEKNLDIILGSRFLDKRSKIPAVKRRLILPVARLINLLFTGVRLTDAHNGFRILSRAALGKIKITQEGMAHNSEIIAQMKKGNLLFAEYPVEVVYHEYGQGFAEGVKVVRDLIFAKIFK